MRAKRLGAKGNRGETTRGERYSGQNNPDSVNLGIGSVRPNYTFTLDPFAPKVGLFAPIIKKYFNEHNAYFNLK